MNKELKKTILEKIKNIQPKAKWKFILKNYLAWIFGALSLLIGAITTAVIIYIIQNNDYGLYRLAHPSPLNMVAKTLPYFWIISLIIFIIIVYYNLKHTKKGYKLELYKISIIVILASIFLGIIFYNLGLGEKIDHGFSQRLPFYRQMMRPRQMIWLETEQGLLAGKIINLKNPENFTLLDLNNQEWEVIKLENNQLPLPPNFFPNNFNLQIGLDIKAFGKKIDQNHFQAFIIRPLKPSFPGPGRPFR